MTSPPLRIARNAYYQEYLRTERIEIDGVLDVLAQLSGQVRMASSPPQSRRTSR